ncbi:MAG TPA: MBL fold metallo-hydrolase [Bryobacteraceae bacterium]|nr:MBL fold metallo-hydrolase [Bryobacteraceae bacterium]
MKLTFWGAAQTVTGSMHELLAGGQRFLLDCGTYQGRRHEARARNSKFPFGADSVNAVVLSHAHIDHSGNLPTLVKNGFSGPIFSTPATVDLCAPLLTDSAYLQERDVMFLNKRASRRRTVLGAEQNEVQAAIEPLYNTNDVENMLPLFRKVPVHTPLQLADGLHFESFDAGHMLGSSFVLFDSQQNGRRVRLAFSGDIGRPHLPIVPDPEPCPPADFLILESTYGNRLHQPLDNVQQRLADIVTRTAERGGKIIVPAFALGRTQQLVILLNELATQGRIPTIPVFVDSPLAVKTTAVYRAHQEAYDAETTAWLGKGLDPFGWRQLRYIQDVNESKALNDIRGPFVVISASGMCEGGRILHHLRNNIENPRNTVLITGFQAEHTLGRKIVEKHREVPIFGDMFRLRAEVAKLNEISGHGDQGELLQWMKPLAPSLKKVFLVHGELPQQQALAQAIEERYELPVAIPARGDSFEL